MSKIIRVVFDDGEELEYVKKPIETFEKESKDDRVVTMLFNSQYRDFKKQILERLDLYVKEYAKNRFSLVEENNIDDYTDEQILEEAEWRSLLPEDYSQNTNIYNQDFIDRFSVIINRGDDVEIERMLQLLEYRFKIG